MISSERIRLLIVEDDRQDYRLLSSQLKRASRSRFSVEFVMDFEHAAEAMLADEYDVCLIDFFLGEATAVDLLTHARNAKLEKPIVVMTGAKDQDLDDQVIELGAADFLPKEEMTPMLVERTIRHALERSRCKRRLASLAKLDGLTGLANRSYFEDELVRAMARAERNQTQFAVFFIDLDRFKEINDSLGHHVGDLLLKTVARRLLDVTRANDLVARIGGDEFTMLIDQIRSRDDVALIARKVLDALTIPITLAAAEMEISGSLGISLYPMNGRSPVELMQHADMALYEAKHHCRGTFRFYSQALQDRLDHELEIERQLREALRHEQLKVHFQPQFDMTRQRICGAEALVRWFHPELGQIEPAQFIPVAEKTGLIIALGRWVLEHACRVARLWYDRGLLDLRIAVNVSPVQLRCEDFIADVTRILDETGLPADLLELELTEHVFLESTKTHGHRLGELVHRGVHLTIDDFGTGFSSLRYLRDLPVQRLKIDRCFVSADDGPGLADPAIAKSIIALAHNVGLEVLAEGVESEEQLAFLTSHGCNLVQGFFMARPREQSDLLMFTAQFNGQATPN
ncbi:EAL domain-containing protein [Sulfidibacter corallicola]|uniref:EAL domain-containing protein n=1 Tax=Sulfidibacter corallicola TaxID=2818388 RepID=A0A8A4TEN2_SULCO|nr:GGDEF domain-containing response regulator [Sulfidibacter corallicola]QTD48416.1 EAL domain-containing protein [Sulfidibacter corallicola]